jgi:hypothetical protein
MRIGRGPGGETRPDGLPRCPPPLASRFSSSRRLMAACSPDPPDRPRLPGRRWPATLACMLPVRRAVRRSADGSSDTAQSDPRKRGPRASLPVRPWAFAPRLEPSVPRPCRSIAISEETASTIRLPFSFRRKLSDVRESDACRPGSGEGCKVGPGIAPRDLSVRFSLDARVVGRLYQRAAREDVHNVAVRHVGDDQRYGL